MKTEMETKILRCVVLEDEAATRRELLNCLSKFERISVVGDTDSVSKGYELIKNEQPDAIFMDIKLIGGDAFSILKRLKTNDLPVPKVVIVTGFPDFSVKAINDYHGHVVKFITKPFLQDYEVSFQDAIDTLQIACADSNATNIVSPVDQLDFMFIKTRDAFTKISFTDIRYIQVEGDGKVSLVTDKTAHVLDLTMVKCLEKLPRHFYRIHRNYAVNVKYIQDVNRGDRTITLDLKMKPLPISEEYYKALVAVLNTF